MPLLRGVEDVDLPEERRRTPMRHGRNLSGLSLATIERATKHIGRRSANGLQRVPEVCCARLVGDVLHLPDDLAAAHLKELLTGKLKVIALHVDRPALVADDVE